MARRSSRPIARVFGNRRAAWAVVGGLGVVAVLVGAAVVERVVYTGEVLPGVDVEGIDVEGLDERAALAAIGATADRLATEPVTVRAGDRVFALDPTAVGFAIDAEATVRHARTEGRSGNPFVAVGSLVERRFRTTEIPLRTDVDDAALEATVAQWSEQVGAGAQDGGITVTGTAVEPVYAEAGTGIDVEAATGRLQTVLASPDRPEVVELPIEELRPTVSRAAVDHAVAEAEALLAAPFTVAVGAQTLTITPEQVGAALTTRIVDEDLELVVDPERLAQALGPALDAVTVAPVDASFAVANDGSVSVVPSQAGQVLDLAAVAAAIADGQRTITGRLTTQEPARNTAWAEALRIREQVSTFTTRHPAGQPRVRNIHRACDLTQNTVVEPGQVFSLNDTVGARTIERGFVQAPVFYGEFTEDVGGGVSQFATTVFNAAYFGGYDIVSHKPHTIYFSRYPMGREATVNYPTLDLKFRNDSGAGILVRCSYDASSITVTLYGDREGRVVETEGPNVLETIAPSVEYVDDPTLPPGTERRIERGYTGYVVENFRIIKRPGQPDERERFAWRYRMLPDKVARGTAPATTTTTTAPAAPPAPPTTTAPPPVPPTTAPPATTTPSAAPSGP